MLFAVHALIAFGIYKMYKLIKAEDERYDDRPGALKVSKPSAKRPAITGSNALSA